MIAQDVVSTGSDFHVHRFRSGPGHLVDNSREILDLKLSEHSEVMATPVVTALWSAGLQSS